MNARMSATDETESVMKKECANAEPGVVNFVRRTSMATSECSIESATVKNARGE